MGDSLFNAPIHTDRKPKVLRAFDKASKSYDRVATVQAESSAHLLAHLLNRLPDFSPKAILDLGSGTGQMVESLHLHFPKAHYWVNDVSPKMLEAAKDRLKQVQGCSFLQGDIECMDIPQVDLMTANFVFQWLDKPEITLKHLLRKTPYLLCSFILDGSLASWNNYLSEEGLMPVLQPFYTEEALEELFRSCGFCDLVAETRHYSLCFPSAKALMQYFKDLGACLPLASPTVMQSRHLLKQSKPISIDYRVRLCLLRKSD